MKTKAYKIVRNSSGANLCWAFGKWVWSLGDTCSYFYDLDSADKLLRSLDITGIAHIEEV